MGSSRWGLGGTKMVGKRESKSRARVGSTQQTKPCSVLGNLNPTFFVIFSDASLCDHLCVLTKEALLQTWGPQEPVIRLVSHFGEWAHSPDSHSLVVTHVSSCGHPQAFTDSLRRVFDVCPSPFLFQRFPKATMITWLKSTSRGASAWTTRQLAPSSSPSACLSMTTLPRLWEKRGCRLNPSLPPAPPHPPAAPASLIPPLTATAQISPTKSPTAAHRQLPATGL